MKTSRRRFLQSGAALASFGPFTRAQANPKSVNKPLVISTWNFGVDANAEAWKILASGGRALDAVEAGVRIPEADPKVDSIGLGGLPDRDGRVTLDACIMDEVANCGSVAFLEHI